MRMGGFLRTGFELGLLQGADYDAFLARRSRQESLTAVYQDDCDYAALFGL